MNSIEPPKVTGSNLTLSKYILPKDFDKISRRIVPLTVSQAIELGNLVIKAIRQLDKSEAQDAHEEIQAFVQVLQKSIEP